jgi:hypothetical protein
VSVVELTLIWFVIYAKTQSQPLLTGVVRDATNEFVSFTIGLKRALLWTGETEALVAYTVTDVANPRERPTKGRGKSTQLETIGNKRRRNL